MNPYLCLFIYMQGDMVIICLFNYTNLSVMQICPMTQFLPLCTTLGISFKRWFIGLHIPLQLSTHKIKIYFILFGHWLDTQISCPRIHYLFVYNWLYVYGSGLVQVCLPVSVASKQ